MKPFTPILLFSSLTVLIIYSFLSPNSDNILNQEEYHFFPSSDLYTDIIDSFEFAIDKEYYISGIKKSDTYTHKPSEITTRREFYPNGRLKSKETDATYNHIPIGKWEYYSPTGELDSIVDYDAMQNVPFGQALQIAWEYGFQGTDFIPFIDTTTQDKCLYWVISSFNGEIKNSQVVAETILVSQEDGCIAEPDFKIIAFMCK